MNFQVSVNFGPVWISILIFSQYVTQCPSKLAASGLIMLWLSKCLIENTIVMSQLVSKCSCRWIFDHNINVLFCEFSNTLSLYILCCDFQRTVSNTPPFPIFQHQHQRLQFEKIFNKRSILLMFYLVSRMTLECFMPGNFKWLHLQTYRGNWCHR